jgi:hypothetical protein
MRIALLLDPTQTAQHAGLLRDATDLARRGHDLTLVSARPLTVGTGETLRTAVGEGPDAVPEADLLLATSPATVEQAVASRRGPVARYVTEPDPAPGRPVPCIVAGAAARLGATAHGEIHEIGWTIDRAAFHPLEPAREPGARIRIGTLGAGAHALETLTAELDRLGVDAVLDPLEAGFGRLDEPARGTALRALDLLAVPGLDGPGALGPTVAEALACGLPCVLADLPPIRRNLGGRTDAALLVEAEEPADIAEAIVFVLRNRRLRAQLRTAALGAVAGLDRDRHVDELERAAARIAARARGPAPIPAELPRPATSAAGDADLVHALASRAEQHLARSEFTAAATCLDAAIAFVPDSAPLWTQLGAIRLRADDPAAALAAAERAVEAGGASFRLHELRATALSRLARPADALAALAAASRCEDAPPVVFRRLAAELRARGDLEQARIAEREAAVRAACG